MKLFFTWFFVAFVSLGFSQTASKHKAIYFIKGPRFVSTKDSADYIRIVSEPDSGSSLFTVQEFLPNGKLISSGYSSKVEHPNYEGILTSFYESGRRKSMTNYEKGVITYNIYYYPNGKLKAYLEYPDGLNPLNNNPIVKIMTFNDSLGRSQIIEGNGRYHGPDVEEGRWQEGDVKNGLREGTWKGGWEGENTTFEELYDKGKLIKGECKTADGKIYGYSSVMQPASFKDVEKLMLRLNSDAANRRVGTTGTVIVNCLIDRKGTLSDFTIRRSLSAEADNAALNIAKRDLSNATVTPAILAGHTVTTSYGFTISFVN